MNRLITADRVVSSGRGLGNAILVRDGRVAAIGDRSDLESPGSIVDAYPGGTIIPGLRDAHFHAVPYAALLNGCSLKASRSMNDLQDRIVRYAGTLGPGEPLIASRFDDEHLHERRLPTRADLDAAVPDRPVVIYRYCGHIAVANTAALAASSIDASTPDPEGGTIDRDADGTPTGVLRETASGLIRGALARGGRVSGDQLIEALHGLAGLGLTSIGAMMGYGESPSDRLEEEVELWRSVAARLPIRVHGFVIADTPQQLASSASTLSGAGPRLRWLGSKGFADGSLGGHTAAMHRPFHDAATTGTLRLTARDADVARESLRLGGMVAVHAIGDRAVDGVLDIFSELIDEGARPSDLRVEHVSVIAPAQVRRFAQLGVTASVQPAFLASESTWVTDRVGRDRAGWLYPFRSMRAAGIPMAGSSDCPVEPPNPLWGIAAAIDRHGITPDEGLSAADALDMFTSGSAAALREQAPLALGSPADVVVVDRDPSSATASDIRDTTVVATFIDGEPVEVDRSRPTWVD